MVDQVDRLRHAVRRTKGDRPFDILAMVVLPDHLHCIWRLPIADSTYSQRWGMIKARFSRDVRENGLVPDLTKGGVNPALRKGEVGIWQKRFWEHHVRDATDLANHVRHCHFNPVKHGLVARPQDWLWNSVHRKIKEGRSDPAERAIGYGEPRVAVTSGGVHPAVV